MILDYMKFTYLILFALKCVSGEDLRTKKVFVFPIGPETFNWTREPTLYGYWYKASLINAPDLPQWMNYLPSKNEPMGFLYGVPPKTDSVKLEITGLLRDTYETRQKVIHFNITDAIDPAKYLVRLKIDNINLEDLFDEKRLNELLKIFTDELWKESVDDLQMTFIASALEMGGRLPLEPNEGEGVVVNLGSTAKYSRILLDLQEEVKPLYKLTSCPRNFKRSTVDRHFRPKNFMIDWCSFRLEKSEDKFTDKAQYYEPERVSDGDNWNLVRRESVPKRRFVKEILTVLVVPFLSLFFLVFLLSFVLCFHHDKVYDSNSEEFFDSVFSICEDCWSEKKNVEDDLTLMQYEAVQRATNNLRSTGLQNEGSPRLRTEKVDNCRPSPPPYSATKRLNYDS